MRQYLILSLVAVVLSSCGLKTTHFNEPKGVSKREGMYLVALDRCPILHPRDTTAAGAFTAALVAGVVGAGIDLLAGAVEEASKAGETPANSIGTLNVFGGIQSFPSCIVAYRGKVSIGGEIAQTVLDNEPVPDWFTDMLEHLQSTTVKQNWGEVRKTFLKQGLLLPTDENPGFFFQGRLVLGQTPSGKSALKLVPLLYSFQKPQVSLLTTNTRSVSVGLGVTAPGSETKTSALINLGNLSPGDRVSLLESGTKINLKACNTQISASQNAAAAVAVATKALADAKEALKTALGAAAIAAAKVVVAAAEADLKTKQAVGKKAAQASAICQEGAITPLPLESAWFGADIPPAAGVRTLTFTLTEVGDKDAALAFATKAIGAVKTPVTERLEKVLGPGAAPTPAAAVYEAQQTYYAAVSAIHAALGKCGGAPSDENLNTALSQAAAANVVADTAGLPLIDPSDSIFDQCR